MQEIQQTIGRQLIAGKIAEVVAPAKELFELQKHQRGESHWQTVDARWRYETLQRLVVVPREVQEQFLKAIQIDGKGGNAYSGGRYAEAQALYREALEIRHRILGADHPYTADSYYNVASTLDSQGKSAEAEAMFRRVLAMTIKALGDDHPPHRR